MGFCCAAGGAVFHRRGWRRESGAADAAVVEPVESDTDGECHGGLRRGRWLAEHLRLRRHGHRAGKTVSATVADRVPFMAPDPLKSTRPV